ncbi:MAG: potassium-transporting ATPase subunit F [Deltaproteobacteria bacterium]|nr:potassium-transporting ATPase subunit F [Deltaproteobacteria bacterium]MBK9369258.1 potassium-transporting ATPase subunit F [Deltaproteobacteria bacterium]MBK9646129.1 potassium-transporting ATPase subunit F [Deltaproteobacteria bacterium]
MNLLLLFTVLAVSVYLLVALLWPEVLR